MGQQHARLLGRLNGSVRLVGIVDPHADLSVMDADIAGVPFFLARIGKSPEIRRI
jgi:hypothetical protein